MSWLEELERDYKYQCEDKHLSLFRMPDSTPDEVVRADATCHECGKAATYLGFAPIKLGQTGRVLFEQNGRYGYEIRRPDGSITRISKTKWDYLESFSRGDIDPKTEQVAAAKITPAYTPAYKEHLRKIGRTDLLQEAFIHGKRQNTGGATITNVKGVE